MDRVLASLAVLGALGLASAASACGQMVAPEDAGVDADAAADQHIFCSAALGPVDASAPDPPNVYECTDPRALCWFGPSGYYVCCIPDAGGICVNPNQH